MNPAAKTFFQRWLITTLAVLVAASTVPGIEYDTLRSLFVASLLLGILNAFVRPIMLILSLPLLLFTLGLFALVINALLLYFVGWLLKGFHVTGFWPAFWGSLVISLISMVVNGIFGTNKKTERAPPRPPPTPPPPSASGPIIDV